MISNYAARMMEQLTATRFPLWNPVTVELFLVGRASVSKPRSLSPIDDFGMRIEQVPLI